jgi:hypothetical protein
MFEIIQTWPMRFRITAAAAVVALIGVAGFYAWHRHAAPPVRAVSLVKRAHAIPKIVRVTPPKAKIIPPKPNPSVYAQEQQMGFSALMNRWSPLVGEASRRFNVPAVWIRAVMQLESGGRTMLGPTQPMRSTMGAMGLMQLMPETYADMRRQHSLGADPYDPRDNILAGAAYLRFLRDKYGYPAMFAAYNDGPGNLEARLQGRGLLPPETQNYVGNVITVLEGGRVGGGGHGAKVRLTKPNGEAVMIDTAMVSSVRAAFPDEYAPGVLTVITMGRMRQGVKENLTTVKSVIRAHGGGV